MKKILGCTRTEWIAVAGLGLATLAINAAWAPAPRVRTFKVAEVRLTYTPAAQARNAILLQEIAELEAERTYKTQLHQRRTAAR